MLLDYTFDHMMREACQAADDARLEQMNKALLAYHDKSKAPLSEDSSGVDDNVLVNYSRTIVAKGVSFLFGDELKIEIKGDTDRTHEDLLEEVWSQSYRAEDLLDLATNGGITGHTWAQTVVEDGRPRVVVCDPLNMSAEWDERDLRRVNRFRAQWNSFDESKRSVVRRQDTTRDGKRWMIQEFVSYSGSTAWHKVGKPVVWKYEFAPVFHVKNLPNPNVFYGEADLNIGVLRLEHYINRLTSLINRILRLHAYPKTVAYGIAEDDLQIGVGGVLFVDSLEAKLQNLEMQSDLSGALAFRKELRQALAEISHVPEITTGKTENLGALSGRAMQILYGPLIDETKKKRLLYGRLLTEIIVALLTIKGKVIRPADVVIHWGEMLPVDEKEKAEIAILKRQIGYSEDTLIREMGGDPENERKKRQEETREGANATQSLFNAGRGTGAYEDGEDEELAA